MFNLFSAHDLSEFITRLAAYVLLVSLVGFFRAWVSKEMGDDTAEEQGYLTLSPMAHVSALGIVTIALFGVGVINMLPLNPHMYHGKHRKLKMFASAYSGVFAYFTLAIVALISLILLCGDLTCANATSSIIVSIGSILWVFIQMSLFFAVLELVSYSVFLLLLPYAETHNYPMHYIYFGSLVVSLLLVFAFGDWILALLARSVEIVGASILHLIGV